MEKSKDEAPSLSTEESMEVDPAENLQSESSPFDCPEELNDFDPYSVLDFTNSPMGTDVPFEFDEEWLENFFSDPLDGVPLYNNPLEFTMIAFEDFSRTDLYDGVIFPENKAICDDMLPMEEWYETTYEEAAQPIDEAKLSEITAGATTEQGGLKISKVYDIDLDYITSPDYQPL